MPKRFCRAKSFSSGSVLVAAGTASTGTSSLAVFFSALGLGVGLTMGSTRPHFSRRLASLASSSAAAVSNSSALNVGASTSLAVSTGFTSSPSTPSVGLSAVGSTRSPFGSCSLGSTSSLVVASSLTWVVSSLAFTSSPSLALSTTAFSTHLPLTNLATFSLIVLMLSSLPSSLDLFMAAIISLLVPSAVISHSVHRLWRSDTSRFSSPSIL
mmetsp:Transcript_35454/g.63362  ORF Transcript_35454/g.63362 Transcript_35454/m.63362 type:complete len:212 (+) Transcript_35454:765-1400(+)